MFMPLGISFSYTLHFKTNHNLWTCSSRILLIILFGLGFHGNNLLANTYAASPALVDTIDCDPGFYQTIGAEGTLVRYEYDGFELGFEIIAVFGFHVNATAFNVIDGFMYCIANGSQRLIRFDTDGNYTDLGPLPINGNIFVGGFDTKGNYYVMQGSDTEVFKINVNTLVVETLIISTNLTFQAADWAYVEADDKFYGVGGDRLFAFDPNNLGVIAYPLFGLENTPGGFGGAFSTANGGLFVSNNQTGSIFLIDISSLQALEVIGGPPSGINDGASCPCALPPFPAIIPQNDTICISAGIPFNVLANDLASLAEIDRTSFTIIFDPLFGEVTYDEDTGTVLYTTDDPSLQDFFVYEICLDSDEEICAQAVVNYLPNVYSQIDETICEGDTLFFQGEAFTEEGLYEFQHAAQNGCDSIVSLNLNLNENSSNLFHEEICEGDEFEYNGEKYFEEGSYEFTYPAQNTCDSFVTFILEVNPIYELMVSGSICDDEAFEHNGVFFSEEGLFEIEYQSEEGCDSIVYVEVVFKEDSFGSLEDYICAGETYQLNDSLYTEEGSYVQYLEGSNGCDSTLTFTLIINPVFESNRFESICDGEEFVLEDGSVYSESGDYLIRFAAANGCDSIVNLNISLKEDYELELFETICEGEVFTLNDGSTYSEEDSYQINYIAANGCDSILILNLLVLSETSFELDEFICEGEFYTFGDIDYYKAGNYQSTFTASNGCDSIVDLNLSLGYPSSNELVERICQGDTYLFEGMRISEAGYYEELITAQNGCDSLITLNLEILQNEFTPLEVSICEGESFTLGAETYFEEGVYEQTYSASNGCDSLVRLELSIAPNFSSILIEDICDGETYLIDGQVFDQTGDYEIFIPGTNGCDSIIFLSLTTHPQQSSSFEIRICEGEDYEWLGSTYSTGGQYEQTLSSFHNCDSLITLTLLVDPVYEELRIEEICQGEEIEIDNQYFSQTGFYELNFQTNEGCDSVIILDLLTHEHSLTQLQEIVCEGEQVVVAGMTYSNSGFFTHDLTNINGCDSVVTLDLFVHPSYEFNFEESICAGESFSINGEVFQSTGLYELELLSQFGCDSVLTLDLLVRDHALTVLDEVICIGSSYSVGSSTYTETGLYEDVLIAINGCDSIVNLNLKVEEIFSTTLVEGICQGDNILVAGEEFSEAGAYEILILASNGCDSLITLDLSVFDHEETYLIEEICEGETFVFNGQDIQEAGNYEFDLVTNEGCDSTIFLELKIKEVYEISLMEEICEGETFETAGQVYSETGEYEIGFVASNGCDSIVLISLFVHPVPITILEEYTCLENEVGSLTEISTSIYGCDSTVVTNTFLLPADECFLIADVEGETLPCDETSGTFVFNVSVGTPPFQLFWSGAQSGSVQIDSLGYFQLNSLLPGDYQFEIIDDNNNNIVLSGQILVYDEPEIFVETALSFGAYDISCYGESDGSAIVGAIGGTAPYTFTWSTGDEGIEADGLSAGNYTVTVVDANNCESEVVFSLLEPPLLDLLINVSPIECFDLSSGSIELIVSGGVAPYTYVMNETEQAENQFEGLTGGTFDLQVYDANDCLIEEIVWLNTPIPVDVSLGEDIYIDLGESATIQALVNLPMSSLDSIFWSSNLETDCNGCLNQLVFPIITTAYSINVDDENGCSDADDITIHVDRNQDVFIPNVFSPNGDGINDVFMIFGNESAPPKVNSLHIYDRWGNKLFEDGDFLANDVNFSWDGSFRSEPQNPGVFVWYAIIEFFDGTKVLYEGDVTLIR